MTNSKAQLRPHRTPLLAAASLLLVASLLLFLAACGADESPESENTATPTQAAAPTVEPTAAPSTSAAPQATEAPPVSGGAATAVPTPTSTAQTSPATPTSSAGDAMVDKPQASGGWVRVGSPGAATDAFNPFFAQGLADYIGIWAVYDSLAWLVGAEVELGLAESITPNEDGSEWTIVLKEATFHDGSPVRPEDVAYSFETFANPEKAPFMAQFFFNIDTSNMSIPDERTLVVPLYSPQGDFLDRSLAMVSIVVPEGSIGGPNAIGSGPFMLEAYEAGKSIRMVRNDDYWDGPPLLDGVEVIIIDDASARLNALKGGEIEFAMRVSPAAARAEANNPEILLLPAGVANASAHAFAANTNIPPFDNPDVVRALKLAVDREALINIVLLGYGDLGNDVVGKGLPGYNDSLPQVQRDVEEARRLFEVAGVTELSMMTGEIVPGATAAAELLVQQLAEVGVTLTLNETPAEQYYSDFMALFTTPLQSAYWVNRPAAIHAAMATGSNAVFNLTGIGGEEYDPLLGAVIAEVDAERRSQLAYDLQAYLYENDGMVVWAYQEDINASVPGLTGVTYSQSGPRFHRASLEE